MRCVYQTSRFPDTSHKKNNSIPEQVERAFMMICIFLCQGNHFMDGYLFKTILKIIQAEIINFKMYILNWILIMNCKLRLLTVQKWTTCIKVSELRTVIYLSLYYILVTPYGREILHMRGSESTDQLLLLMHKMSLLYRWQTTKPA